MKKNKLFGMILIIGIISAVMFLGLASCDGGDDDGDGEVTYSGISDSGTYTLEITKKTGRAVYTPQNGDSYTLTYSSKYSTGTITVTKKGDTYTITLNASNGSGTVTVTVTDSGIVSIDGGGFTWDNGGSFNSPGTIIPSSGPGTGGGKGKDSGSGGSWPPAALLAKYGLSGLSAPSGATGISYVEIIPPKNGGYSYISALMISFDAPASTETAIDNWFTNNWDSNLSSSSAEYAMYVYRKTGTNFQVIFNYYREDKEGMIMAYIMPDGYFDDDDEEDM